MRRILVFALLGLLALNAGAETSVRVVATDPGAEATLGRDEAFHVRIEFTTDEPVRIWARPFFQGKEVLHVRSNPSGEYSGSGHALGWFSLYRADAVDEVRIKLGGGKRYREWDAASYPVRLTGTGVPAAERALPAWVNEMRAEQRERLRQAGEKHMNEPMSAGDMLFMAGFVLVVLGLLLAGTAGPAWAVWKWRGGWRIAAAMPGIVMAFVIVRILVGTTRDPTSHNLWPFEILMAGGASAIVMGVLALLKRLVNRKTVQTTGPQTAGSDPVERGGGSNS